MPTAIYAELLQDASYKNILGFDITSFVKAGDGAGFLAAASLNTTRFLDDSRWAFEEKHNGDRRLVSKDGNGIRDFNRKAERGKGLSPKILAELNRLSYHQFIIDCEYVEVENRLYVFDVLAIGDDLIFTKPLSLRKSYLHSAFDGFSDSIIPVVSANTRQDKLALVAHLITTFAEGFVTKDLEAEYRQSNATGTVRYNYKVKFWKDCDCVVIGDSTERNKDGNLKDSVRLGCYDTKGVLKDVCGATKKSSFILKPGDVVIVKYIYATKTLDIVQPTILRQRFDKYSKECTLDQLLINKNWRRKCQN